MRVFVMAKIFTIANRKGGAGKTTIATNLAVALSRKGNILLVDTDDQLSAFNWNEYRTEKLHSIAIFNNLADAIQMHFDNFDFILIDMAGRDSELFREALLISDALIVPTQPSILDLEILPYVADKVFIAQEINSELKSYVVINRASSNYKNIEAIEAKKYIDGYPIFKLLDTVIHDRKAFRDAMLDGKSVLEMSDSKASDEINNCLSEIF